MTQDTNNQEWWEGVKAEFSQSGLFDNVVEEELDAIIYGRLAKVSQQSREDALKECLEEVIEALKTKECEDISCSEHYHRLKDSLKSKLC